MEIKNLIEETVIHKAFGKGVIKKVSDKYLEIFFPEKDRWSKFLYPSCFDVFLKLENEEKAKEVARDVEQWRIDIDAAQREQWRQQYEKRQQDIKDRKLAAEEKKKRAGQRAMEFRSNYNKGQNGYERHVASVMEADQRA